MTDVDISFVQCYRNISNIFDNANKNPQFIKNYFLQIKVSFRIVDLLNSPPHDFHISNSLS